MNFLNLHIPHLWTWLIVCLLVFCFVSYIMSKQANLFVSGRTGKKFSIFDLEFPASRSSLQSLIQSIDLLPNPSLFPEPANVKKAIRSQLWLDFIFMPAAYGGIFLLCMAASYCVRNALQNFFIIFAWMQMIAWLFDILENILLFRQIKKPVVMGTTAFKLYQIMELLKWSIASLGLFLSIFALCYCWLMGINSSHPLVL